MFLKDIRDNILTMSFTTLSSSMKTSEFPNFLFHPELFEVLFFIIIIFVFDSLLLKKSLNFFTALI